ncbi:MAG: hypothetical protein ACRDOV_10040, partial [Streptomyces sp.]
MSNQVGKMTQPGVDPSAGAGTAAAGERADPVARAVREEVRAAGEGLRAELSRRAGLRSVRMRGAAAAAAFYGGGAVTVALGLGLALV